MSKHWLKTWPDQKPPAMFPWENSDYPHACVLLESEGIDPNNVDTDSVGVGGYSEIQKDATGLRLIKDGIVVQIWRKWPTPEFGVQVAEAMRLGREGYGNSRS